MRKNQSGNRSGNGANPRKETENCGEKADLAVALPGKPTAKVAPAAVPVATAAPAPVPAGPVPAGSAAVPADALKLGEGTEETEKTVETGRHIKVGMAGSVMDVFWKVIRGSGTQQSLIDQVAESVAKAQLPLCRELITHIKKLVKSPPESPVTKLQSLRVGAM